ncbi:MAG: 2-dehydropantoate 2-reductase, partial [Alcaligenaceae bacterium]|nr:2-dehydropantoate 2-reductase [Alcaligenaceae bacterium]
DLVFFGVKLWDTEAAARSVAPQLGRQTAVVSFQNSVVKDDILRDVLGADHVMGGVCYIASTVSEPGVIRHSGTMQKLVFGEYDGGESPRALRLRDACAQAGIDVELSQDIQRAIWEKFVFLSAFSGITSAVRAPIGPVRANEQARAFLHDAMDEAVQVARAEGVAIPADYAEDRLVFADQLPASMTSSMYHDLERGNRIELAWLSGDVLARGERLGVPTPCNRAIVALLSIYGDGSAG